MAFLYLFDLVTSISLSVIVKCSSWIIYGSSSGIYYLYKKMRPNNAAINQNETFLVDNKVSSIKIISRNETHQYQMKQKYPNDVEYIMITREEYDKLTKAQLLGEIHVE